MKHHNSKILKTTMLFTALFAASPVMAVEQGDILINARLLNIAPDVNSNQVRLLSDGSALAAPAGIDVDDAFTLGVDITYMVTNNFGVELMLDTTSNHSITGTGNLSGVTVGDVSVLPPSVIAVWHFTPKMNVRPYVGAGLNYTFFFSEDTTGAFTTTMDSVLGGGVTSTGVSVDDKLSLVLQAGIDIDINNDWYVSLDMKYIDMDTTATVQVNGADAAKVDFDVNPLILGIGIGTRF